MSAELLRCPGCSMKQHNRPFYRRSGQPVNSVVLCATRESALNIERGDITLVFCSYCGFIFNSSYNPALCRYDRDYEERQSCSPTFSSFSRELAERIMARCQLNGGTVIEIGCGKGDFLFQICQLSGCRGIGYDPSYVPERAMAQGSEDVVIHARKYPFDPGDDLPDCIVCKMTLEHLPDALDFLRCLRKSLPGEKETALFFLVPNMETIMAEARFWDIYYEHCSYFSAISLANLFKSAGFFVDAVETLYGEQYLFLQAGTRAGTAATASRRFDSGWQKRLERFEDTVKRRRGRCLKTLRDRYRDGGKIALWGGGSKGVSFLCHLEDISMIDCVVDINPYKQGRFLPGTAHPVISPESLPNRRPDLVLAMNSIYIREIREIMAEVGVRADLLTVDQLATGDGDR
jgi:SAM-dependent methyltransferase